MIAVPKVFASRREYCVARLEEARREISSIEELDRYPDLAIYATGSYARQEASALSDLDLFFLHGGEAVANIDKTLIDSQLIQLTRAMGLPEFSGDGKYLGVHSLDRMKEVLGAPEDDYSNLFTARLLLVLESTPLCHAEAYEAMIRSVVETYYRDFKRHSEDFMPLFLVNDIIRFWRTVCLNYESDRELDEDGKRKARVKNLKLKFSRPFTCFSGVLLLATDLRRVTPERVVDLVHMTPLERIIKIAGEDPERQEYAQKVVDEYAWFLETTEAPQNELAIRLAEDAEHAEALRHAEDFLHAMYQLIEVVTRRDGSLRYLVI